MLRDAVSPRSFRRRRAKGGRLSFLRQGPSGRLSVLPVLRGTSPRNDRARAAEDGNGRLLRRHGLDGYGRVERSGGAPRVAGRVLRADARNRGGAWRYGGEVHRRRGDGR